MLRDVQPRLGPRSAGTQFSVNPWECPSYNSAIAKVVGDSLAIQAELYALPRQKDPTDIFGEIELSLGNGLRVMIST